MFPHPRALVFKDSSLRQIALALKGCVFPCPGSVENLASKKSNIVLSQRNSATASLQSKFELKTVVVRTRVTRHTLWHSQAMSAQATVATCNRHPFVGKPRRFQLGHPSPELPNIQFPSKKTIPPKQTLPPHLLPVNPHHFSHPMPQLPWWEWKP